MTLVAFLGAVGGFVALALAMERHHGALLHRRLTRGFERSARLTGAGALAGSCLLMMGAWGAIVGGIAWIGMLSAAAAIVLLAISRHATR